MFRNVLAFALNTRPGVEVVAECGSVAECRALGNLLTSVDVGLLDLGPPDGEGTELIADLRGANPAVAVIVL